VQISAYHFELTFYAEVHATELCLQSGIAYLGAWEESQITPLCQEKHHTKVAKFQALAPHDEPATARSDGNKTFQG
jgi:hypothetical protein